MPQIFDVTANENARYKRNELELDINIILTILWSFDDDINKNFLYVLQPCKVER